MRGLNSADNFFAVALYWNQMRWLAILIVFSATVFAFPRLGLHDGYTRLVFDLDKGTSYKTSQTEGTFTIKFSNLKVQASDTDVDSPQVASYQVVPDSSGATAFVRLKTGTDVKAWVMGDDQGRRLVVDVLSVAKPNSAISKPTKPQPQPPQPKIVVLDAGHGGIDPGAQCYVSEEEITLDVVLRLRPLLQAKGIQVVLTRDKDKELSPDKATDLSLRAAMANSKRNLYVSIHVNSTDGCPGVAQGVEVWYFGQTINQSLLNQVIRENGGGVVGQKITRQAQTIADRLMADLVAQVNLSYSRRLAQTILAALSNTTNSPSRGIQTGPLAVLRQSRIPAVLVEIGFGNHPGEGKKLAEPLYRQVVAGAIASAIAEFLDNGASAKR